MIRHVKYFYSTEQLALLKSRYNLRICFRKRLTFLRLQSSITKNLSNRIAIHSQFITSYKQLRKYYINLLRGNFMGGRGKLQNTYKFQETDPIYFLTNYIQSNSFNELDVALIWRAAQINSIFKIIYKETKKKKKFFYKSRIQFVTTQKRILLVWKWLNVFIKSFVIRDKPWHYALQPSLENFLISHPQQHILSDVKLQIYRLQLIRTK